MAPNNLKMLIGSIRRKPTNAPDRKTDDQAGAGVEKKTSLLHDVTHLGAKNTRTMAQALTTLASGDPLDDKELLLENGVSMLQSLPVNSGLSSTVSDGFIKMLYHDLPHPPGTLAGPTAKYRRHDGGNNNPWVPEMGKAGTPYSRSVPPMKPKGPNLPDPELVFEQLLKRKGPFREHPSGLNRLFFSFATIVIHECFQTNRENQWINETSSYVDLSTLYGNTEKEQVRVRSYQNGKLYPDSIASERIMLMPPGVVALLVMFSRNHNSIVESLLSINEEGKYGDWDKLDEKQKKWQDEDLFQLGRNINVGFFAAVVLHDYVAAILNTPRANSEWSLDLGKEIKNAGARVERGTGNVVSVEFAVLYHWHAALSAADANWMEELLRWHLGKDLDLETVGPREFYTVVKKEGERLMTTLPKDWTFDKYKRGADGRFDDHELAELIKDCINEPAHEFGAHGTPASLKVVDLMGQLQARDVFNVCTMNEFRRYLNLKAYESFEEWNPDKEVARAAELLYGHIENLELYPGLMAECTKPAIPGSGVCPGQTTGRGILDDAVALVRGDRYLSYDFNSNTLTNWGVGQLSGTQPGSYGGTLPQLIFRGLPSAFPGTSAWSLLPFYTPKAVKGILQGNKALEKYDLERPRSDGHLVSIQSQEGCKKALEDREIFRVVYPQALKDSATGQEFMLSPSDMPSATERYSVFQKGFFEENFEQNIIKYFREKTARLIAECDLEYPDTRRAIDIVRDVTNYVPILWLAERFAIPLKTMEQPRGLITPPRLLEIFQVMFLYQNANWLPDQEWKLRAGAEEEVPKLKSILEAHLKSQSGFKEGLIDWMEKGTAFEVGPDADRLFHALNKTKIPLSELAGDCIGVSTFIAGSLTAQASLLIDLFLSPGYEQYKTQLAEVAQKDDAESWKQLEGFVMEGMRHANAVPGLPRVAARDVTINDGSRGSISIKAEQKVLIATSTAGMDPTGFPLPEQIDPSRQAKQMKEYSVLGHGSNYTRVAIPALAAILKEVFKLKNLRRENGRAGKFTIVEHDLDGVKLRNYLDANAKESPIPTTLRLMYNV